MILPDLKVIQEEGALLAVDKPEGWTSFDVVRKIRNLTRSKIGHAGTLDPLATGLLLLATGRMTKKLSELSILSKEYEGSFFIGATTPSFDRETEVSAENPIGHLTERDIFTAAAVLKEKKEQLPPAFSAIKIGGTPSYKLARKGKAQELSPRPIQIYDFEILKIELPLVYFRVSCSKGTYIRSLARDFGEVLGTGAYLYSLRRTRIGDFDVENAWKIEELAKELKEKQG